jgi:hypothetical protein
MKQGVDTHADLVIIDTAGRLHTKVNLMNELTKIKRVMQKFIPDAPHEILLKSVKKGQSFFEPYVSRGKPNPNLKYNWHSPNTKQKSDQECNK